MITRKLFSVLSRSSINTVPSRTPFTRAMHVQSIPMWTGSSNNYAYLVVDDGSKDAVIIDPAHPEEVTPVLKAQIDAGKIKLTAIINTHHHWDQYVVRIPNSPRRTVSELESGARRPLVEKGLP